MTNLMVSLRLVRRCASPFILAAISALSVGGCRPDAGVDEDVQEGAIAEAIRRGAPHRPPPKCAKDKVRICHFEGKKHSARIIEVPEQALPAHLAHGDGIAPLALVHAGDCAAASEPVFADPEAGGLLEAAGVTVRVSPGALSAPTELRMTVTRSGDFPVIDFTPDVRFEQHVRIEIARDWWTATGDVYAMRVHGENGHYANDVNEEANLVWFEIPGFSRVRFAYYSALISQPGVSWSKDTAFSWEKQGDFVTRGRQRLTFPNTDICYSSPSLYENRRCAHPDDCQAIRANLVPVSVGAQGHVAGTDTATSVIYHPDFGASILTSYCDRQQRPSNENVMMSPEVREALDVLSGLVAARFGGKRRLWLNAAVDSTGYWHETQSRHYSGRAVDLDLCVVSNSGACNTKVDNKSDDLGTLADLAFHAFTQVGRNSLMPDNVTVFVHREADHVHAELTSRCPDPWSVWDDQAQRCRRPKVTATLNGEGASAGTVSSTLDGNPGNLICMPTSNPAEFECNEAPDGGLELALTATVEPGSGADFAGWSGDCTGSNPVVTFPGSREDIDCTATFECPSGESWNAGNKRCEVTGAPPGTGPCTDPATPSWNGQYCEACPQGTGWNALTNSCAPCPTGTSSCGSQCVSTACSDGQIFDYTTCSCGCPVSCCGRCFQPYYSEDPYYCCARNWCRSSYYGC